MASLVGMRGCSHDTSGGGGPEVPIPRGRAGHGFYQIGEGAAGLLVGGYNEDGPLADVWLFDLSASGGEVSRIWQRVLYDETRDHPLPRVDFAGCLLGGGVGYFYLVGGMASDGEQVLIYNDLWRFELSSGVWTRVIEECPWSERMGHVCVALDEGNLLIHGGQCMGKVLGDTWFYNATSNTWIPLSLTPSTPYPIGRCAHSACFLKESATLLVFGGYTLEDGEPVYLNDLWVLDMTSFNMAAPTASLLCWQCIATSEGGICPSPRDLPAMCVISELALSSSSSSSFSRLVIAGGFGLSEVHPLRISAEGAMETDGEEEEGDGEVTLAYLRDCWIVDVDLSSGKAGYSEIQAEDRGDLWGWGDGEGKRGCTMFALLDGLLISYGGFAGETFSSAIRQSRFNLQPS